VLVDTHVHFDGLAAGDAVEAVLERAAAAGVTRMVAVGGTPAGNATALRLATTHAQTLRAAIGYDRGCVGSDAPAGAISTLFAEAAPGTIVAVGETGLDFHYSPDSVQAQARLFTQQLDLARNARLPVIVHSREADDLTVTLLRAHAQVWPGTADRVGVLHCFTGDAAFARRVLDLGLYLSFSGIVTFRNADALREVARFAPGDRLLIETDTPYLTPVPHRGRPNEPANLPWVAAKLAEVRGCRPEEIALLTSANAARLFAW
jgi:TatD DNase family protein